MSKFRTTQEENEIAVRKLFAVVCGIAAAFFAYVTLTVPLIAATAPAILCIAAIAGTILLWPRENPTK
jgi:hypothetical protein